MSTKYNELRLYPGLRTTTMKGFWKQLEQLEYRLLDGMT